MWLNKVLSWWRKFFPFKVVQNALKCSEDKNIPWLQESSPQDSRNGRAQLSLSYISHQAAVPLCTFQSKLCTTLPS